MNVYEIVTEKVLRQMEQGEIPWRKPWKTDIASGAVPFNFVSGKAYRGVNRILLDPGQYVSYKQAKELGGSPKKGKSQICVFWKILDIQDKANPEETNHIPMLRYYQVWNVRDVGLTPKTPKELPAFTPIETAEKIVNSYGDAPNIQHEGDRAFYSPHFDFVSMPTPEVFDSPEYYYSVLFHELTHSTGHKDRLNREGITTQHFFGDPIYSKEELVAEMGSCFLRAQCGIETPEQLTNSVAYLQSWLRALSKEPKLIVLASAQAQRAADYILGVKYETEQKSEGQRTLEKMGL